MKLQIIIQDIEGKRIKELAKKENRSVSNYVKKILLERLQEATYGAAE